MLKHLNWNKGLLRLWGLASALWCATMGYGLYVTYGFLSSSGARASADMTAMRETQVVWLWILGPAIPLLFLTIGLAIIWIARGFKASNEGLNWKRGLLRLWVSVSALWCTVFGFALYGAYDFLSSSEFQDWPRSIETWENRIFLYWISLAMPLVVLAIGLAIIWVARGFKASNS